MTRSIYVVSSEAGPRSAPSDRDKELALIVMLAVLFDNPDNERAWLAAHASLSWDEKLEQVRRESGYY